jgi:hypothetical protein|tara:strand:+ start:2693 stop:2917 length:225 start_codon:yes stop_codon:yes gene_type:complete
MRQKGGTMKYIDFYLEVQSDGSILLDPELTLEQMNINLHDTFVLTRTAENQILLKQVDQRDWTDWSAKLELENK